MWWQLFYKGTRTWVLLVSLLWLTVGCGGGKAGPAIESVQAKAFSVQNDLYAEVGLIVKNNGYALPGFSLPVPDPRDIREVIGQVSSRASTNPDRTEMGIAVNLSRALSLATPGSDLLPNGNRIPISGGSDGSLSLVRIPLSGQVNLYAGIQNTAQGTSKVLIGTSALLAALDPVGGAINQMPLSLFFPIPFAIGNIPNAGQATIGLFTGRPGQNGLGVFTVFPNEIQIGVQRSQSLAAFNTSTNQVESEVQLKTAEPKGSLKIRLYRALSKIKK